MDMSNKSLALLLVATIIISLGGTLLSLNKLGQLGIAAPGRVTGMVAGNVSLTIAENVSCTIVNNVSFGSASSPAARTNITTDVDNSGAGFNDCSSAGDATCGGILINNTGNVDLVVNFTSDNNGTDLLGVGAGHTNADFQYMIDNTEVGTGACNATYIGNTTFVNVTGANINMTICNRMNFTSNNDSLIIDFNITIQPDITPAGKTALLTVNCAKIS